MDLFEIFLDTAEEEGQVAIIGKYDAIKFISEVLIAEYEFDLYSMYLYNDDCDYVIFIDYEDGDFTVAQLDNLEEDMLDDVTIFELVENDNDEKVNNVIRSFAEYMSKDIDNLL